MSHSLHGIRVLETASATARTQVLGVSK
jgi:hypothetical protein